MQQPAQRYLRRQRGFAVADESSIAGADATIADRDAASQSPLRERRRRPNFSGHLATGRELIRFDAADAVRIAETAALIRRRMEAIVEGAVTHFLSRPEIAGTMTSASGAIDHEALGRQRSAFRRWLISVVDAPLDAALAEELAAIAHDYVRPRDPAVGRVRARGVVAMVSFAMTAIIEALTAHMADAASLGPAIAAWTKLLAVHLDIFLAVFSSTERSPHWY